MNCIFEFCSHDVKQQSPETLATWRTRPVENRDRFIVILKQEHEERKPMATR